MPGKNKTTEKGDEAATDDFTTFESTSSASDSEQEAEQPEMSAEKRAELLKGFDSDSDSEEEAQGDEDDRIIELSNLTPSISSALSKKKSKSDESGVLYIGRIPHGFYEEEMTSYFTQFGAITNLRMSRSKKTGRSRHFGFIEFADREVAQIVAETMHNYLLASHLLQVILLTPEEVEAKGGKDLFKGGGKKFKAVPWAQIAKQRVEAPKTKEQWQGIEKREKRRRETQSKKIKAAGIDYEYESPAQKRMKQAETPKAIESKKEAARKVSGSAPGPRKSSGSRKVSVK